MIHATYSPSKLELIEACPRFGQQDSTNEAAIDAGNRMHHAAETGDLSDLDSAEVTHVKRALDYVDEVTKDLEIREFKITKPEEALSEEEIRTASSFFAGYLDIREAKLACSLTYGFCDRILISVANDRAYLFDYKFGKTEITAADDNMQAQAYTLAMFETFPWITEVEVHFIAPVQDFITQARYTRDRHLDKIVNRINKAILRADDPFTEPTMHQKACSYCRHKATCPAFGQVVKKVFTGAFGLPLPEKFEPGNLVTIRDRELAQTVASLLEDWCKLVKQANSRAAVEEGLEFENYQVVSRKGKTSITDVQTAIQKLRDINVPDEALFEADAVSLAFAKAVVAVKESRDISRTEAEELLRDTLTDVIVQSPSVNYLKKKPKADVERFLTDVSDGDLQ